MRRRTFLTAVATASLVSKSAAASFFRSASYSTSGGVSDLSVTLSGGVFGAGAVFAGATAKYVGPDYIGEHVRQKWYACQNPAFPKWVVWFRVDADANGNRIAAPALGWRDEVVVEYGLVGLGVVDVTSPYNATITKSGVTVYSVSGIAGTSPVGNGTATGNYHYWFSRWRWAQDANGGGAGHYRNVVRTPASLIARGWLPNFTTDGMFGGTGASAVVAQWPGPFGWPTPGSGESDDFDPSPGAGGDHNNVGLLTEQAASYVIFGRAGNLANTLVQGEFTANWQMFIRNPDLSYLNYQANPSLGLPGSTLGAPSYSGNNYGITSLTLTAGSGYTPGTYSLIPKANASASGFVATVTVNAAGQLSSYSIAQTGSGFYLGSATIPIPASAGSGTGGAIVPVFGQVGVGLNVSHWDVSATLPFMLTDDPYYLEAMQFGAAMCQGYNQYNRNYYKAGGQGGPSHTAGGGWPSWGETRAFAWGLREISRCAAVTPMSVPSVMYPKSYWVASLTDCATVVGWYANNPCPTYSQYYAFAQPDLLDSWMNAWAVTVMGLCCDLGFSSQWQPLFNWAIGLPLLLTSNSDPTQGWPRQWFCPYEMCVLVPPAFANGQNDNHVQYWDAVKTVGTNAAQPSGTTLSFASVGGIAVNQYVTNLTNSASIPANTQVLSISGTTVALSNPVTGVNLGDQIQFCNAYQTGTDVWTAYAAGGNGAPSRIDTTGWNASSGIEIPWSVSYQSYAMHVRAALVEGANNGVTEAGTNYAWVQGAVAAWYTANSFKAGQARFSLGLKAAA